MKLLTTTGPILTAIALTSGAVPALAQMSAGDNQTNQPTRLNETTVMGTNLLQEEMKIGDNQQPVWTARRRFATTRVYVQPPWQAEVEMTWDAMYPRMGVSQHLLRNEIELGLPYRFQVDVETEVANWIDGDPDPHGWRYSANSVELRYAFADWDVIPLNPTINVEYRMAKDTPNAIETQLLLGDELAPRWHYGINFFFEQELGEDRGREESASAALSYTVIDEKFSAGMESLFKSETDKDSRDHPMYTVEVGPSFQWRPCSNSHIDLTPMFGVSGDSPVFELFLLCGIEFGRGAHEEHDRVIPSSLQGR